MSISFTKRALSDFDYARQPSLPRELLDVGSRLGHLSALHQTEAGTPTLRRLVRLQLSSLLCPKIHGADFTLERTPEQMLNGAVLIGSLDRPDPDAPLLSLVRSNYMDGTHDELYYHPIFGKRLGDDCGINTRVTDPESSSHPSRAAFAPFTVYFGNGQTQPQEEGMLDISAVFERFGVMHFPGAASYKTHIPEAFETSDDGTDVIRYASRVTGVGCALSTVSLPRRPEEVAARNMKPEGSVRLTDLGRWRIGFDPTLNEALYGHRARMALAVEFRNRLERDPASKLLKVKTLACEGRILGLFEGTPPRIIFEGVYKDDFLKVREELTELQRKLDERKQEVLREVMAKG